jgi:hypothetical protein
MSTCKKPQSGKIEMQKNLLEAKNKVTHTTNQNCILPSSEEEEQKPTLILGQPTKKWVFTQAHAWGGGWT